MMVDRTHICIKLDELIENMSDDGLVEMLDTAKKIHEFYESMKGAELFPPPVVRTFKAKIGSIRMSETPCIEEE